MLTSAVAVTEYHAALRPTNLSGHLAASPPPSPPPRSVHGEGAEHIAGVCGFSYFTHRSPSPYRSETRYSDTCRPLPACQLQRRRGLPVARLLAGLRRPVIVPPVPTRRLPTRRRSQGPLRRREVRRAAGRAAPPASVSLRLLRHTHAPRQRRPACTQSSARVAAASSRHVRHVPCMRHPAVRTSPHQTAWLYTWSTTIGC